MFEDLKKNIEQEKKIIMDMHSIETSLKTDPANKDFYVKSFQPLAQQLQLLNKAVPNLLKEGSPLKKFMTEDKGAKVGGVAKPKENPGVVKMSYVSPSTKEKRFITINEKDKKDFLEKLKLS